MSRSTSDPEFVLRGSKHPVSCVKFAQQGLSNDATYVLLSGCTSGQVRVWDLASRRVTSCLDGHHGQGILAVEMLKNGKVASQGRDGCIRTWELSEGRHEILSSLTVETTNFCKCELFQEPAFDIVAVPGGKMSEVRVVSLADCQTIVRLCPPEGHKALGMPMCIKFVSERQILIGYEDGTIALWDTSSAHIVNEKRIHPEPVMSLEFDAASSRGVSGSTTDEVISWRLSEQGELSTERSVGLTNPGVAAVALREDGKILALGGWDSRVRIFGWRKLKALAVLSYHTETVNSLDFSSHMDSVGYWLAAGSKDTHISVWALYNDHLKT
ncbi:guanine nucleotide-binding protein subunit beta-like protein 1 [Diadema setosum]|uniref:guanine nucleotide-binding protein subunit beta-like protein 1 n=1 Tax=Diadema setosum TaxID=31175 RepID=UPI003B3ABDF9